MLPEGEIVEKPTLQYSVIDGYETQVPRRGSEEAAGIDVCIPLMNDVFRERFVDLNNAPDMATITAEGTISVPSLHRAVIPTGLRFNIPTGTYLEVANRGSMAAKYGMTFGAHIIDSDYQGNVFINLINTSPAEVQLLPAMRVAQLLHKPVILSYLEEVTDDTLYANVSIRGDGALGSTGR